MSMERGDDSGSEETEKQAGMDSLSESQDEDVRPKFSSKRFVFVRTFEEAEQFGVPVISAIRNEDFRFVLRKTNHPHSQLSDAAKEQLFLDALYLERMWLRRKLDGFRFDEFTSSQSNKTAMQYNGKQIADHYQVARTTVVRIIKQGRMTSSTKTKTRSGRPSTFSRAHQQHVLQTNNEAGGCSIRTLGALLEKNPPSGYLTQYNESSRRSPGINTIWRLLQQDEIVIKTVRYRPLLSESNQKERLDWCEERLLRSVRNLNIDDGDARENFARQLETLVDVDECYLVCSVGTGTLYFLPEDFQKVETELGRFLTNKKKMLRSFQLSLKAESYRKL